MANRLSDFLFGQNKKEEKKKVVMKRTHPRLGDARLPAPAIQFAFNRGIFASANQDLLLHLERTRDLSRYLVKIDPYLQRYMEVISVFVVGQDGLKLEPVVTAPNGKLAERVNNTIRKAWMDWCREATYDTTLTFAEAEQMVIRTVARDGEALVRMVTGKDVNKYGFALQILDPTPWTTAVLNTVSRLNQYLEAHLQACSIAATTPLVMTNTEPDPVGVDDVSVSNAVVPQYRQPEINLAYSQILELDHGKNLQALNLQFPSQAFQQTTDAYLKSIASGLFISYATLTADPSQGNSANVRFSSIVEREHFQQIQRWLIKCFHMKVYKKWIEHALLHGGVVLPSIDPKAVDTANAAAAGIVQTANDAEEYAAAQAQDLAEEEAD